MKNSRRDFIKKSAITGAGTYFGALGLSAQSYRKIIGANDRVRVGVVGFSDRHRGSHAPSFMEHYKELNFDIVAVSDLWKKRRDEGTAFWKEKMQHDIKGFRNNDELYDSKSVDAVFMSTADFQHALLTIEAVKAGCDVYAEKPFAETMEDNRAALKAVKESGKIVQIGSQRRSGNNYKAAADFVQAGKFGNITMVELTWNVNQPGRWRRPALVAELREEDTDWKRFLLNRPYEPFNPRHYLEYRLFWPYSPGRWRRPALVAELREEDTDWKRFLLNRPYEPFNPRHYLEYRLFWPYSSGMPGQWMSHQIDTVHWFSGLKHPRTVVANGGVYVWKDGRQNWDTTTAVFEYGDQSGEKNFQVIFSSRMHNGDENPAEIYYSNGGELNLITNKISPRGGLHEKEAAAMGMKPNLLPELSLSEMEEKVVASANTR